MVDGYVNGIKVKNFCFSGKLLQLLQINTENHYCLYGLSVHLGCVPTNSFVDNQLLPWLNEYALLNEFFTSVKQLTAEA